MLVGQLVKFQPPCIAKFCSIHGTSDFIIEQELTGIVLNRYSNPFGIEELEVVAAGEILISIDLDDVQFIKQR